jgi:4-hydroxythreonine-4-phosphate dehydrogenase
MSTERLWADDLTGACELADLVRARRGFARVELGASARDAQGAAVVDLDLRHAAPSEVTSVLDGLLADVAPAERVAFKIDSQLHGPVTAYLAAFIARKRDVFFCPANLDAGRVVVDGVHRIPSPAGPASVALSALIPPGGSARVTAARHVDDIAGLRRFAADARDRPRTAPSPQSSATAQGILVIAGSSEPIIEEQLTDLRARHPVDEFDPRLSRPDDAARALQHGRIVLVNASPAELAHAGDFASATLSGLAPDDAALILTGGHTARRVLTALGIESLTSLPSPVTGVASLRDERGLSIFTKPGSYGRGSTLRDVADVVLAPSSKERS